MLSEDPGLLYKREKPDCYLEPLFLKSLSDKRRILQVIIVTCLVVTGIPNICLVVHGHVNFGIRYYHFGYTFCKISY